MTATHLSIDTLDRARERFLETLEEMTLDEANTMPQPLIKSVTWLIWHTSRTIDYQISNLAGLSPVWFDGHKEAFRLDLPDDTEDWKHTPQEAAKVIAPSKEVLINYLNAAITRTHNYLENLPEESLSDIIDTSWTPAVTRQVRIVSTIDDAVMHSGQAVYSKRLVLGH